VAHGELKDDLRFHLEQDRSALLSKLEGLGPYDARRPMTPTATNLLGLVKHVGNVQAGYLGVVFDRPFPEPLAMDLPGAGPNEDMWARADESLAEVTAFFQRSNAHADATIAALPLDTVGRVPWWPRERREVTLHRVLVRLVAEVGRHCGHADILRELIDGRTGWTAANSNLPEWDPAAWAAFREQVETAARAARS
jgi:uncharacterized protein DUF664